MLPYGLEYWHQCRHDLGSSAGIILHKELVQGAPSSANTNHHGGPQDPHQTQLLGISKPVFSLADLEDLELLPAGTRGHLPLDLVVDPLGVGQGAAVFPVGSQRGHELPPVDHAVTVVELVGDGVHLQLGRGELIPQDSVDEFVSGTVTVTVIVQLPEEVLDTGLLVVVVLQILLPPGLPVKVLHLLQLLEVVELVLESPVSLPGHHPDVSPLVPQSLGAGVLDASLALAHAGAASLPVSEPRTSSSVGSRPAASLTR